MCQDLFCRVFSTTGRGWSWKMALWLFFGKRRTPSISAVANSCGASSVSRQARAPRKFENPSDRDIYMGLSALRQVPRTGRHRRLQWEHGRNGCPREFVAWRKLKVEENQTKWPQRHRITTTRMTTDKRISLKSPAAFPFKAIRDSRNNSAFCHLLRRTLPSPLTPPAPGSA